LAQENCSVTIYGLTAEDAHRIVRIIHDEVGAYWARRIRVSPTATEWVVEGRHEEGSNWIHAYGPWSEFKAFLVWSYWNRHCGWEQYRAVPVMTGARRG
jgi:hypothetical protein